MIVAKKASGIKNRYIGYFNYSKQICIEYCFAYTKEQARVVFCNRLARKHGVHVSHVLNMFNGEKDNFSVTIETEFTEDL